MNIDYKTHISNWRQLASSNCEYFVDESAYNKIVHYGTKMNDKIPINDCIPIEDYNPKTKKLKSNVIHRFSFDKVGYQNWWNECYDKFPFLSICGSPVENITTIKEQSLAYMNYINVFTIMQHLLKTNDNKIKVLEIGCGYNGMYDFLEREKNNGWGGVDYYCTDVVKRTSCPTFYLTDGKTIPQEVGADFDFIFSANVFQHIDPKDRYSYYKQAKDMLKDGCSFVFTMFLDSNKSTKNHILSYKNKIYSNFLGQYIKIDKFEDIEIIRHKVGYRDAYYNIQHGHCICCTFIK